MKKHLLFLFATLLPFFSSAQVEVNGIYYNLDANTRKAEVTSRPNGYIYGYYEGEVSIPATIFYAGVEYSVTSIGEWAFGSCSNLTAINIPEGVTSIGEWAFLHCNSLITINIPKSVTSIAAWAFDICSNLISINIPENSQLTSIGERAFHDCSCLTAITIPASVTSIGEGVFATCTSLSSITVARENTVYDSRDNCNAIIETNSNSVIAGCCSTIIPEGVTSIGGGAFENCMNLTTITIPASVTSIGEKAFTGCMSLTAITIPASVTSIRNEAFSHCMSLTAITIPEGVTSIGEDAFNSCSSLIAINIPENVTRIGKNAFDNTAWYNNQPNGMIYLSKFFYKYKGSMPEATSIDIKEGTKGIVGGAFMFCDRLTSITIPESVTYIGDYAFSRSSLTSIIIPKKSQLTNIGFEAFSYCSNLTTITIPESVTSIENRAFQGCSSLTTINIPKSVINIGEYTFYGCSSLHDVYCYAVAPPSATYNSFNNYSNITLHVPASALEAYKTTAPWSSFGKIVSIEPAPATVTITINKYGSGTYSSPYALDFSEVKGLYAYAATGYNGRTGVVTLTRIETAQDGIGLFIKGTPNTSYEVPILESTDDNTLNMMVPTLVKTDVNTYSSDGQYANYKYTVATGETSPRFHPFSDGSTLSAGKAYLQIPRAWIPSSENRSISLRFDDGEGTTDMESSEYTIDNSQLTIHYDLYGRRVAHPERGKVYIINGQKVIY